MRISVVGGSGYLGTEILHQAQTAGYQVQGTYRTHYIDGLDRFDAADDATWPALEAQSPDCVIWCARPVEVQLAAAGLFPKLRERLHGAKLLYVSSDAAQCASLRAAETPLGDYARRKYAEQLSVLAVTGAAAIVTGPIYGENSQGNLDDRTHDLLAEPDMPRTFWSNVYKTFVPVDGLARAILSHFDASGLVYAGPPERQSYYEFYHSRAAALGLPINHISPHEASPAELVKTGICADMSYADNSARIW